MQDYSIWVGPTARYYLKTKKDKDDFSCVYIMANPNTELDLENIEKLLVKKFELPLKIIHTELLPESKVILDVAQKVRVNLYD